MSSRNQSGVAVFRGKVAVSVGDRSFVAGVGRGVVCIVHASHRFLLSSSKVDR